MPHDRPLCGGLPLEPSCRATRFGVHELFGKLGSCFREDFGNGVGPRGGYVERPLPGCGLDLPNDRSWRLGMGRGGAGVTVSRRMKRVFPDRLFAVIV
jgi:hypothetical protein